MRTRCIALALTVVFLLLCMAAGAVFARENTVRPAGPPAEVKDSTPPPSAGVQAQPAGNNDVIQVFNEAVVASGETVKNVIVVGANADISGHVTDDVVVVAGDVRLRSGAVVDGDVVTALGKLHKENGAVIRGKTESKGPEFRWTWDWPGAVQNAISFIVLGILAYVLFPRRVSTISEVALRRPWKSALYGILAGLLFVPILLLLLITIVGIPLIGIEILLYVALLIMGGVGIRYAVGQRIAESRQRSMSGIRMIVIGSIIMAILDLIPLAGDLVAFILSLIGVGAAAITWFGSGPDWLPNRFRRLDAGRAAAETGESGTPGSE